MEVRLLRASLEQAERILATLDENDEAWHPPPRRRNTYYRYLDELLKRRIRLQDELYDKRCVQGGWKLLPSKALTATNQPAHRTD